MTNLIDISIYVVGFIFLMTLQANYNKAGAKAGLVSIKEMLGKRTLTLLLVSHSLGFLFFSFIGMEWYLLYVVIVTITTLVTGTNVPPEGE